MDGPGDSMRFARGRDEKRAIRTVSDGLGNAIRLGPAGLKELVAFLASFNALGTTCSAYKIKSTARANGLGIAARRGPPLVNGMDAPLRDVLNQHSEPLGRRTRQASSGG